MSKLVSFAVGDDNAMTPEEIEASQFQKVHFRIYSADRVNAHGYTCSLKVLKKYAKTICGKPILAYYNKYAKAGNGDCAGHEDSSFAREYPIGFFPENTDITYEKDDNGTIFLCADGYIWEVYYHHITELFNQNGGKKGVSSEMLILDSEVIEETNVENILQYSFAGLTVLGDTDAMGQNIVPAVEGCQGVLVTNSSMNSQYQKAKEEFEKILYHSSNQESVSAGSFFNTKNQKEEAMGKEQAKNSSPSEVVENAEQVITTETKVSQDTHTYGDHGEYLGSTHESHKFEKTEIVDVTEDTTITATNAASEEEKDPEKVENATDPEVSENACDPKENACNPQDNACDTQDNACDTMKNADTSEQEATDDKQDNACKKTNANPEEEPVKEENASSETDDPDKETSCKTKNAETNPDEEQKACKTKNADSADENCRTKNSVTIEAYNSLKNSYDALLIKCQKLEEYKNNRESQDMKNAVELALNNVSHILDADQIDTWRNEATKYSYAQFNDFSNKLKAFAFDVQEKKGVTQPESLRNSIPKTDIVDDDSMDLWDRLSKKYA